MAERAGIQGYQRKQQGLPPTGPTTMDRLWDILIPTFWIVVALSLIALWVIGLVTVWGWLAS